MAANAARKLFDIDAAVVGAGIVGLATARQILIKKPQWKVVVFEKEDKISAHQTGRNSNVIHSGLYYKPDSLKAKLCVRGADLLYQFCDKHNVDYKRCGKLIVAVTPKEVESLQGLLERGRANGVQGLRLVSPKEIKEIEPNCEGLGALYSPNTGIVDYEQVSQALATDFVKRGGEIVLSSPVTRFDLVDQDGQKGTVLKLPTKSIWSRYVVGCAGLFSDQIAVAAGGSSNPPIVAFRGEYSQLIPEQSHLVKGMIYPVNNPAVPFLGVHFTKRMDGGVDVGPNAVLAFAREGYSYFNINFSDLSGFLSHKGTRKLFFRYWRFGLEEYYRSLFRSAQVKKLRQFIPQIQGSYLTKRKPGVRALAVSDNGDLLDDFIFDVPRPGFLNVRNAPSPAATSALSIAEVVVDRLHSEFAIDH